ncbi:SpoIID/LytB domain-containing protein [Oscillatoria sp. FACHB-1407]|uniref:SpoIID/LytB domain-containing protein n=1 Tax=Oscillatoria sp. FACHB-1407 TaxID=2692847 RepID=UPI0016859770|nr:SpoIID/LytB domain-containing protein [Oscillatoria sp. FACHB-1407]MBD2460640.1 SpoIID/LytB domain-containing protein [Oscillatoria sp. FACHB-1407]
MVTKDSKLRNSSKLVNLVKIDAWLAAFTRRGNVKVDNLNNPTSLNATGSWRRVAQWTGVTLAACVVGVAERAIAQSAPEPVIDVGIVQRFGDEADDQLTLQPLGGDRLTLQFKTGEQTQTVTTTGTVKLEVTMQPLPQPQAVERVVLSTHRSFESAEDSANQWRAQGIEVEIAQPRQWQVWAKRDTYHSPLLRRLLLQNLRAQGSDNASQNAFIDSQVQQRVPKATFTVNGYRYQRDNLQIATANSRVYVGESNTNRDRRLYGGRLHLQPNAYGTYTLVNRVPIETYLRGVVPHEIGLGAPSTTIEAQAILARTYALRNLRRFAIDNYQLCADTQCQVYRGLTGAAAESDRAIAATRGLVLTYENELVDALYSSTTGGVTAPFSDVWNGPNRPYLRAVVDSVQNVWNLQQLPLSNEQNFRAFINRKDGFNENGWDMFRWQVESNLIEIETDLREYLRNRQNPLANFTRIESLEVVERSAAGRVLKMAVQTDRGLIELQKDEIMRALYAPNSTLFYIEPVYETVTLPEAQPPQAIAASPKPEVGTAPKTDIPPAQTAQINPSQRLKGYVFVGGGLGHGVGMSQTGAYNLGDLRWSAARILSFYYPGTQVQPLNADTVYWREPEVEE